MEAPRALRLAAEALAGTGIVLREPGETGLLLWHFDDEAHKWRGGLSGMVAQADEGTDGKLYARFSGVSKKYPENPYGRCRGEDVRWMEGAGLPDDSNDLAAEQEPEPEGCSWWTLAYGTDADGLAGFAADAAEALGQVRAYYGR